MSLVEEMVDGIDSDADYILVSEQVGVLSEHCTIAEARMAYFQEATRLALGGTLPVIFQRAADSWMALG